MFSLTHQIMQSPPPILSSSPHKHARLIRPDTDHILLSAHTHAASVQTQRREGKVHMGDMTAVFHLVGGVDATISHGARSGTPLWWAASKVVWSGTGEGWRRWRWRKDCKDWLQTGRTWVSSGSTTAPRATPLWWAARALSDGLVDALNLATLLLVGLYKLNSVDPQLERA